MIEQIRVLTEEKSALDEERRGLMKQHETLKSAQIEMDETVIEQKKAMEIANLLMTEMVGFRCLRHMYWQIVL